MNDSRALAAVGIGAGLGMLALAAATHARAVQRVDDAVERRVGPLRPRIFHAARIGTLPGEPYAHWSLGAAVAGVVIARRGGPVRRAVVPMAGASLGAIVAHHAVKAVYRRVRPRHAVLRGKTEPAFPSGHTTDATAVLVTAAYLLARSGLAPAGVVATIAALLAVVTGVSRVLLGWHWPTDVLGGWLAGAGVAACATGIYESLLRAS
jgi:membrane-associated phospholipid phosphatase